MDRRELLKKSAVVGGAMAWSTPIVQSLGQGTAHAAGSPTCIGCLFVQELTPGNNPPTPNVTVNSQSSVDCAPGCIPSITFLWTTANPVNVTFPGPFNTNTLPVTITSCASAASATVTLTVTWTCQNPDGRFTTYSCFRTENVAWPDCSTAPSNGTLVATDCIPTANCN